MTDPVARLQAVLADRYRFERKLGEGGMATVHLAHDLRHDRKVAVKVLRPEVAVVLGAERFLAEIKTTASLQHPNILALFDSGASEGLLYYVMPYVEGESLRDRLNRETQLDVETAVAIATEVAGALDYAHRRGVIHRDIKPENILLHDGRPVVADFGIALAVSAAAGGRMTETGLSLGTPHYMSPEQAVADPHLTGRTDVFSLGVVLYEMLVGTPPHHGASAQQVVAKIVTEDATPVSAIRKAVPPNISDAVGKALERVPADRFATAKGFADALHDPAFRTARSAPPPGARRRTWLLGAIGLAAGVLLGLWLARAAAPSRSPAAARPTRFLVSLPDSAQLVAGAGVNLAWSPDGSRLVYVGPSPAGEAQLWQRRMDQFTVEPIPGTESARIPTVSPNDSLLAFTAEDALKVVSLYGGPLTTLVPKGVPSAGGGIAWSDDGRIYFVDQAGAIESISASGGAPSMVVAPDTASGGYMWLDALPGRAGLLVTIARVGVPEASQVVAVPASGGPVRRLVKGTMARYVRPGYLVFTTAQGALMAAPFDEKRLAVTGTPVAVGSGVDVYMGSAAQFAVSRNGSLAWVSRDVGHDVIRVDRHGVGGRLDLGLTDDPTYVVAAPDGRRVALTAASSVGLRVWIKDLAGGRLTPVPLSGHPQPGGGLVARWADAGGHLEPVGAGGAVAHAGGPTGRDGAGAVRGRGLQRELDAGRHGAGRRGDESRGRQPARRPSTATRYRGPALRRRPVPAPVPGGLPRWPLAPVLLERVGARRGLRDAVPRRRQRQVAGVRRRRARGDVGPQREGGLLPERIGRPHRGDGRGGRVGRISRRCAEDPLSDRAVRGRAGVRRHRRRPAFHRCAGDAGPRLRADGRRALRRGARAEAGALTRSSRTGRARCRHQAATPSARARRTYAALWVSTGRTAVLTCMLASGLMASGIEPAPIMGRTSFGLRVQLRASLTQTADLRGRPLVLQLGKRYLVRKQSCRSCLSEADHTRVLGQCPHAASPDRTSRVDATRCRQTVAPRPWRQLL